MSIDDKNLDLALQNVEIETVVNDTVTENNSHEITPIENASIVEGIKQEYTIIGDGLFASTSVNEAPLWLTSIIDSVVNTSVANGQLNYNLLVQDVLNAISSIDVARNTYVEQINLTALVDGILVSRLETLNATVASNSASIINLDTTVATGNFTLAQSIDTKIATFNNSTTASLVSIQSAFASADSALAADITALSTNLVSQNEELEATSTALSGVQSYVGLTIGNNPDGTGLLSRVGVLENQADGVVEYTSGTYDVMTGIQDPNTNTSDDELITTAEPYASWIAIDGPNNNELVRQDHIGDVYIQYEVGTGNYIRSFKFIKTAEDLSSPFATDTEGYTWSLITDTEANNALIIALQARDMADSKRRVFVGLGPTNTPSVPYDEGDLWLIDAARTIDGQSAQIGDIFRAVESKGTIATYEENDWVIASSFVTAVNAIQADLDEWRNTSYDDFVTAITTQVDQKSQSFYQEDAPRPVGTVVDNPTYSEYVGDLWKIPSSNLEYIYSTVNSGADYAWVETDVPDSVYDTIDGKKSIYVGNTPPAGTIDIPINLNDMWISGAAPTEGYAAETIYVATQVTPSVVWTIPVKYTDDSAVVTLSNGLTEGTVQINLSSATIDGTLSIADFVATQSDNEVVVYSGNDHTLITTAKLDDLYIESKDEIAANGAVYVRVTIYKCTTGYNADTLTDCVWTAQTNADASLASLADLADGKRTIFSNPSNDVPTGVVNDLWIPKTGTTASDLIYIPKEVYQYDGENWILATKFSEDLAAFVSLATSDSAQLHRQIDGKIEYYFYETFNVGTVPVNISSATDEASALALIDAIWTTQELKDSANGNIVYFKDSKNAYWYQSSNDVWLAITDTSIYQALQEAAQAKGAADGKISQFYAWDATGAPADVSFISNPEAIPEDQITEIIAGNSFLFWFQDNNALYYKPDTTWIVVPTVSGTGGVYIAEGDVLTAFNPVTRDHSTFTYNGTNWVNVGPDGIIASSTFFVDLANDVRSDTGLVGSALTALQINSNAYTDGKVVTAESNFNYDSTLRINNDYYRTGFGLNSNGIGYAASISTSYLAGTTYVLGDVVAYLGSYYKAKKTNLGITPTNGVDWQLIDGLTEETAFDSEFYVNADRFVLKSPRYPSVSAIFKVTSGGISLGVEHTEATRNVSRGSWNNDDTFISGDIVSYQGSSYIAFLTTTGNSPSSSPEFWQLLAAKGTDSIGAGSVDLFASSYAIFYDVSGTSETSSITLSAVPRGATGTLQYVFKISGSIVQAQSATTTYSYTPPAVYSSAGIAVEIEMYADLGGGAGFELASTDQLTLIPIKAGSSAINVTFSNPNHTFSTGADGNIEGTARAALRVGSGGEMRVYEGATLLNYNGQTPEAGYNSSTETNSNWRILSSLLSTPLGVVSTGSPTGSGNFATMPAISNMTEDTGTLTFTVVGKSSSGVSFLIPVVQSFSKAKQGGIGNVAKAVKLNGAASAISYNAEGNSPSVASILFTAVPQGITDPFYRFYFNNTGQGTVATTTTTRTYTSPASYTAAPVSVRVDVHEGTATGPVVASDEVTVYSVKDGKDAYTVVVENDTHVVPTASDGTSGVFTGSGTEIRVYQGSTLLTFNAVGDTYPTTTSRYNIERSLVSLTSPDLTGMTSTVAVQPDYTAAAQDVGTATFTIRITNAQNVEVPILIKKQTITKSKAGSTGTGTRLEFSADNTSWHLTPATTDVYMRKCTSINGAAYTCEGSVKITGEEGTPGNYTSYRFAKTTTLTAPTPDVVLSTLLAPTGWSDGVPSIVDGEYVWMTKATIAKNRVGNTSSFIEVLVGTWSAPVRLNGANGATGLQGVQGLQGPSGEEGIAGPAGANGSTSYFHIAYANDATGSTDFTTGAPGARTYIGTYVDFNITDSTNAALYSWVLVKGADGADGTNGIAGTNGANGETSYLHIAYANDINGSTGFTAGAWTNQTYIGQYTDFTLADSTDPADYTWSLFKGLDGVDGLEPIVSKYYWGFSDTLDGFTAPIANGTLVTGTTAVTLTNNATTGITRTPNSLNIIGDTDYIVVARIRCTSHALIGNNFTIYYNATGPNTHGETGSYFKRLSNVTMEQNQWKTFLFDMRVLNHAGGTDWVDSIINQVRFDVAAPIGYVFEIDYFQIGHYGSPENAKTLTVNANSQTMSFNKAGVAFGTNPAIITANPQNLNGTLVWTTVPVNQGSASGNTYTLPSSVFASHNSVLVTATQDGLSDSTTITKLQDGSDVVSVTMSNQNHTFAANATGGGIDVTGSGTEIRVYEGATELFYTGTSAFPATVTPQTWKIITPLGFTGTISTGSPSDSGTFATAPSINSMGSDQATLTFRVVGQTAKGTPFDISVVQSFSKSKQGVDGVQGVNSFTLLNSANVTITGNSAVKTSGSIAYDAGAYSLEKYTTCSTSFTFGLSGTAILNHVAGISNSVTTDANYLDIDYAIYKSANDVYVFELGVSRGIVTTSTSSSDVFSIVNDGIRVTYYKNGELIYVSPVAPSGAYAFDCSIQRTGASVDNITFVPIGQAGQDGLEPVVSSEYWGFTNTADGFSPRNGVATVGATSLSILSNTADPGIVTPFININGAEDYIVATRLRCTSHTDLNQTVTLYYELLSGRGADGNFRKDITVNYIQNEWITLLFDMRDLTVGGTDYVNEVIDRFRLDHSGLSGRTFEFDYFQVGHYGSPQNGTQGTPGNPGAGFYGAEYATVDFSASGAGTRFFTLVGRSPVEGDVFTQTRTDGTDTQSRVWSDTQVNGSNWVPPVQLINGSLIVDDTIGADQIVANSIGAKHLSVKGVFNEATGITRNIVIDPDSKTPIHLYRTVNGVITDLLAVQNNPDGGVNMYLSGKLSKGTVDIDSIQQEARTQINPYYIGTGEGIKENLIVETSVTGQPFITALPAVSVFSNKVNIAYKLSALAFGNPPFTHIAPMWTVTVWRTAVGAGGTIVGSKTYTGTSDAGYYPILIGSSSLTIDDAVVDTQTATSAEYFLQVVYEDGTPTTITRSLFRAESPSFNRIEMELDYTPLFDDVAGATSGTIALLADMRNFQFISVIAGMTNKNAVESHLIAVQDLVETYTRSLQDDFMLFGSDIDNVPYVRVSPNVTWTSLTRTRTLGSIFRISGVNILEK